MNIGEAARASGVSAKLIRYYEQIGLLEAAERTAANYRRFDARNVHELRFIRAGRNLGFAITEIAGLLALWREPARAAEEIMAVAQAHLAELRSRQADAQALADSLEALAQACRTGTRPTHPTLGPPPPTGS